MHITVICNMLNAVTTKATVQFKFYINVMY